MNHVAHVNLYMFSKSESFIKIICIGKSYNDYIANHQMNMFEDFIGYQGSAVLDESEREADTTSVPMPRGEEFENIPLPDLPEQPVNMQQASCELDERGMPT